MESGGSSRFVNAGDGGFPPSIVAASLPAAILATVAYYDQFKRPLTAREIAERLCGSAADEAAVVAEVARSPHLHQTLAYEDGFYTLAGRTSHVRRHHALARVRAQKWRRTRGFARVVQHLPFVRCIIVGGSLSNGSPRPESDLDLLFLTAGGRLWIARFCIMAARLFWNHTPPGRRHASKQDRIDVVYMASFAGLENPHQTPYAAMLLLDSIALYEEEGAAGRYARANGWVRRYVPGFAALRVAACPLRPHPALMVTKRALERALSVPLLDLLEKALQRWWSVRWYRGRRSEEPPARHTVATASVADFDGYHWEGEVIGRYLERLTELGLRDGWVRRPVRRIMEVEGVDGDE